PLHRALGWPQPDRGAGDAGHLLPAGPDRRRAAGHARDVSREVAVVIATCSVAGSIEKTSALPVTVGRSRHVPLSCAATASASDSCSVPTSSDSSESGAEPSMWWAAASPRRSATVAAPALPPS